MTNQNIANWLKSQIDVGDGISVGAIDESKSSFIGVYDSKSAGKQRVCIGGKSATKYQTKNVVILVHWTNTPTVAEQKAQEISKLIHGLSSVEMDGIKVVASDASAPSWGGRDSKSICEYIVNVKIEYERDVE